MEAKELSSGIAGLLELGKKQGRISPADLAAALEEEPLGTAGFDELVRTLEQAGIAVEDDPATVEPITISAPSADPLAIYMNQVSRIPLLERDEEQAVFTRLAELVAQAAALVESGGDDSVLQGEIQELRFRIIQANLRLVISIARRYQNLGLAFSDLIEEGNIGLIEAVKRFDPARQVRFSTYGIWWIRQAIIKAVNDKSRLIRIPVHILGLIKRVMQGAGRLAQDLGREPTISEIARECGLNDERIIEILRFDHEPSSLEASVSEEIRIPLGETVLDEAESGSPLQSLFIHSLRETLDGVLGRLEERERMMLELRFGLNGKRPHTLEEIARILGITRERVRQLQERAMIRLKKMPIIRQLREFF